MSEHERVLALLKAHGWNATSFQVLEPGFRYFFAGDDAVVAYVDTGSAWVAGGAPICGAERLESAALAFVEAARAAGRRACFFATEERFHTPRLARVRIGEQPHWDPRRWEHTLRSSPSLREQLRRARAKGVTVRALPPEEIVSGPTRAAIDELIRRWLAARTLAPMGFLVQLHPFHLESERRLFVAEQDGRVAGFLDAVPVYARGGWLLEDLLRDPSAPSGTNELLVDAAMRAAAEEGASWVTLGLAPLAGPVSGPLRAARRFGAGLFDFEGLRAFKARLRPQGWDPIYLSFPHGRGSLPAFLDTLAAFARGGLLRFGLETLLRGPAVVIRALALLLVPWTVMLALLPSAPWFPAPWVQQAWVIFDALLAGALLALGVRWRDGLATLLASLVTADALVTIAQVLAWNVPRIREDADLLVIAVAVAAPTFAALVLWRARAHRALFA